MIRRFVLTLEICTAVFAIAAALFWFLSAFGPVPPMKTYWGATPSSDSFYSGMKYSATMNTYAALLSGISALCMALKMWLVHCRWSSIHKPIGEE
jgi:hypothetical protein